MRDAESHADEDKKRRALIDARNQADSLAYNTEKLLKENEEKVPEADRQEIRGAIAEVRKVLEDKDADQDQIGAATAKLETASHKLAEAMYQQATGAGRKPPPTGTGERASQSPRARTWWTLSSRKWRRTSNRISGSAPEGCERGWRRKITTSCSASSGARRKRNSGAPSSVSPESITRT